MSDLKRIAIIEKNMFISMDMKDIFLSEMPTAQCEIYDSVSAARAASKGTTPDLVVVAANQNGQIDASDKDVMWLFQSRVIAIDPRLNDAPPGWAHLNKPFTEAQLIDAAISLLSVSSVEGHSHQP